MSLFSQKPIFFYRDVELEAFYKTDSKTKRNVVLSHVFVYLVPVILGFIYFQPLAGHSIYYVMMGLFLLLYSATVIETISYMNERLRALYKKSFVFTILLVFVPYGGLVGYSSYSISRKYFSEQGIESYLGMSFSGLMLGFFLTFGCFFMVQFGLSYVLKASRTLFTEKARMETDVLFAKEVQERLLKDVELSVHSSEAYACSVPANELGGDYFELSQSEENIIASVGDISGHSFGAGLLMAMMKSGLQTHLQYGNNPADVLFKLNKQLFLQSDRAMYATMQLLTLNTKSGDVILSSAGHLPLLHYSLGSGNLKRHHPRALGLGMSRAAKYSNYSFRMEKGDVLIMVSDGLVETRDKDNNVREFEDFERFVNEALASESQTPRQIAEALISKIKSVHEGDVLEDDASVIVLRY